MAILKKILLSVFFSLILVFLAFFYSFIPCKTTKNIVGIPSSWDFCSFYLTGRSISAGENLFFGRYSDPLEAIFFSFCLFFLIFFILLWVLFRRRKN